MAKVNIKKGDKVMVITGKDKGKDGKVLSVLKDGTRVVVEGVNIVAKSKKPRSAQETGGIIKKEAAIDASNVMHICPACGKVVRIKHAEAPAGSTVKSIRVCAKCGAPIDEKKSAAKKAVKKSTKKKVAEETTASDNE